MFVRKLCMAGVAVVVLTLPATFATLASGSGHRPTTGVGSCTLKGWNPSTDPEDAKDLPLGDRHQTYIPDNYDCEGAKFAAPGVEFAKFPQPHNFTVTDVHTTTQSRVCTAGTCTTQKQAVWKPAAATNPLAPYFPPFTHFVILFRENHTFDDYLGDCATTSRPAATARWRARTTSVRFPTCTHWPSNTR